MTETKKTTAKKKPARKKTVTFVSRYEDLKIIQEPQRVKTDVNGNILERVEGKLIAFENGRFQTDDADTIKFLQEYSTIGVDFHEVGETDAALTENATETLLEIGKAHAQLNVAKLAEIREKEEETANRDRIIEAVDAALTDIAAGAGSVAEADDGDTSSTSQPSPDA
jgi:hypothetical protein